MRGPPAGAAGRRGDGLPPLPYEEWRATKDTLHLYLQIVGKIRLQAAPPRNHWWHVPFHVTARGLTTRPAYLGDAAFEVIVDLVDHAVTVQTPDGRREGVRLRDGLSVASFHGELMRAFGRLGMSPRIIAKPFGVPMTTPFAHDEEHRSYDADAVERFFRAVLWSADVLEEFAGWFRGKTSPVHLFWHSFDLAVTRFSGRRAPEMPGAEPVTREAYAEEVVSFGFWAGDEGSPLPAYYSYTAPEPAGLAGEPLRPEGARWVQQTASHLAVVPYDAVRTSPDPRAALLDFLQSAYEAGARRAGWDRDDLVSGFCPPERRPR